MDVGAGWADSVVNGINVVGVVSNVVNVEVEIVTVAEDEEVTLRVVVASSSSSLFPVVTVVCAVLVLTGLVVVVTLGLLCGSVAPPSRQTLSTSFLEKMAARSEPLSAPTPRQKLLSFASIFCSACWQLDVQYFPLRKSTLSVH